MKIDQLLTKAERINSHDSNSQAKKKPGISKRNPTKTKTTQAIQEPPDYIIRMIRKLWENEQKKDPYTEEEENEIFLQMFRDREIRRYCENPIDYSKISLQTHIEISATLNSFREMYGGLYRWSNNKFLSRLTEKWKKVEEIQKNHVTKLFNKNEEIKNKIENKNLLDKAKWK